MKKSSRRTISALLVLVMLVSMLPLSVFAADGAGSGNATVSVESVSAAPGSTVQVAVSIKDNPGILGARLTFAFDDGLTLVGAENGEAFSMLTMTKPETNRLTSPCQFAWDGQELADADIRDGVILTLTFEVSEAAVSGKKLGIRVSYKASDIVDGSLNRVALNTADGEITVIDYVPGDVNGDGEVSIPDIITLRRYLVDGNNSVNVKIPACDVDADAEVTPRDVILIRRYLAGGYDAVLLPSPLTDPEDDCKHTLEETAYHAPTCTAQGNNAYWHCALCDRYFTDAAAKNETTLEKTVLPATGHTPNAAGTKCSVCGISLTGTYKVQFNCRMIRPSERELLVVNPYAEGEDKMKYSSSEDTVLPTLTMDTYTFIGWSDQTGKIYTDNIIPAGTTGDLILKDNWVSQRNRAKPKSRLDDPFVVEDTDNQTIYSCYEIGTIENVPLYTTQELQCVNGIIYIKEKSVSHSMKKEEMNSLESTIANETTDSTQFTLSKELTESTEVSSRYLEQTQINREQTETEAKSQSQTQTVNSSSGGSSESYVYNDSTVRAAENENFVINTNFDAGVSHELQTNAKNTTEASAGVSFPIDIIKVNAGVKNTTELSASTDTKGYMDFSVGTSNSWNKDTYVEENQKNSQTDTKYWNSQASSSYTGSETTSRTVTNALHEMISSELGYGQTYSEKLGSSENWGYTQASSKTSQSSTTFTYTEQSIESETVSFQTTGNTYGAYRMIMAGTMHMFAVVGYNVANNEYFVYNYGIMGDGTVDNDGWHEIIDYSYDRSFHDFENTVMPFEIPYYVEDYVNSRIVNTEGLEYEFDNQTHTAVVDQYTGSDTVVYVPSYMADSNGNAFKITGIKSGAFRGNTKIAAVSLGRYVSEIPDSVFEGCTSLENVICPAVTTIGNRAFYGCTSLKNFTISKQITSLGTEAFFNVPQLTATVGYDEAQLTDAEKAEKAKSVSAVAAAVAASGAKEITLDISGVPKSVPLELMVMSGKKFVLDAGRSGKEFTNLTLESHADETQVKSILLRNSKTIPLKLYSANVTLTSVDLLECASLALLLGSEQTKLTLDGTNTVSSASENAVLAKEVNASYQNSGRLRVTGDFLYTGSVTDSNGRIAFVDHGEYKQISAGEFGTAEKGSITITLNAAGGTVTPVEITAYYGGTIGALPTPTREYYSFEGWYTQESGGTAVNEDTPVESIDSNMLYAHWTLNELTGWVLRSEVPEGGEIVNQKWTYDERTNTESRETSLSGYTQYGSYWVQSSNSTFNYASFPDGFDTSHWIYNQFHKSCDVSAYETETTKREVSTSDVGFVYYKWDYNAPYANTTVRSISHIFRATGVADNLWYGYFHANLSTKNHPYLDNGYCNNANLPSYNCSSEFNTYDTAGPTPRFFRFKYYQASYNDYYKMFKYYKVEAKESSTPVTETGLISNVQNWVQYRPI